MLKARLLTDILLNGIYSSRVADEWSKRVLHVIMCKPRYVADKCFDFWCTVDVHPDMKTVVVIELERLLYRPHVASKAQSVSTDVVFTTTVFTCITAYMWKMADYRQLVYIRVMIKTVTAVKRARLHYVTTLSTLFTHSYLCYKPLLLVTL